MEQVPAPEASNRRVTSARVSGGDTTRFALALFYVSVQIAQVGCQAPCCLPPWLVGEGDARQGLPERPLR